MPRNPDFIRKLRILLIWYYTQLTRFVVRGPRASQSRLYQKTSNPVNLVLVVFEQILCHIQFGGVSVVSLDWTQLIVSNSGHKMNSGVTI